MNDEVLEFIQRRFKDDCNWTNGNCYFFAVILKSRFPEGKIFYDVPFGHFIFQYKNQFYDWNGIVRFYNKDATRISAKDYMEFYDYLIEWDKFDEYDYLQKERIMHDCIM